MKSNFPLRFICTFIAILFFIREGQSAPAPQWTFSVPAPTLLASSNYSELAYAGSDNLGNTLIIVQHYLYSYAFPNSAFSPLGFQIFLLKSNGALIASTETQNTTMSPLLITGKRLLFVVDGAQIHEFKVTGNTFTSANVTLTGANETPFDSSASRARVGYGYGISGYTQAPGIAFWNPGLNRLIDKGRLYTVERTIAGGLVTAVKRYLVSKLAP